MKKRKNKYTKNEVERKNSTSFYYIFALIKLQQGMRFNKYLVLV